MEPVNSKVMLWPKPMWHRAHRKQFKPSTQCVWPCRVCSARLRFSSSSEGGGPFCSCEPLPSRPSRHHNSSHACAFFPSGPRQISSMRKERKREKKVERKSASTRDCVFTGNREQPSSCTSLIKKVNQLNLVMFERTIVVGRGLENKL